MRTSVALVISAGMSQDINHFPYETVMPYWNANEASKVLLEYKSVVRIWLKFNSRGLCRPKRPLLFSCFTSVFESPVWNLGILPWMHQLDQIRTIPWKIHEKSVKSVTRHHSLYGSFLCPCWTSNFEPLVSIHVKSERMSMFSGAIDPAFRNCPAIISSGWMHQRPCNELYSFSSLKL